MCSTMLAGIRRCVFRRTHVDRILRPRLNCGRRRIVSVASMVTVTSTENDFARALRPEISGSRGNTMLHAKRPPGRVKFEELQMGFQEGQSAVDLSVSLGRTAEFIYRQAHLFELQHFMSGNKKGKFAQWSPAETDWLICKRKAGMPLLKMSRLLRRTKANIEKQLAELGKAAVAHVEVEEGPLELPWEMRESLFHSRLSSIYQILLQSEMAPEWKEALSRKPDEEWLRLVANGIPENVKWLLGGFKPPTFADLSDLPRLSRRWSVCEIEDRFGNQDATRGAALAQQERKYEEAFRAMTTMSA